VIDEEKKEAVRIEEEQDDEAEVNSADGNISEGRAAHP
jgi:hypothetical protein